MNSVCVYDFTAPARTWTETTVMDNLKKHCKKWAFQLEKGETGYEHYQGRVSLKTKARLPEIIKRFGNLDWHFSITSTENHDNDFYATKEETRLKGPWNDKDQPIYIPRQIREITELYPWQQQVINSSKTWDTRTINILLDESGNHGKSIVKTWIGVHKLGRNIPFSNDYRDIMRIVMDTPKVPLYVVDISRGLKKDHMYNFFSAIETIKDGYAYDDRYSFKEEYFDCPTIWIFTNQLPDISCLSRDRWVFWKFVVDKQIYKVPTEQLYPVV